MKQIILTSFIALFVLAGAFVPTRQAAANDFSFVYQDLLAQVQFAQATGDVALMRELVSIIGELIRAEIARGGGRDDDDDRSRGDVEVRTLSADDVEDDEATLRGEVEEGDNVEVWFVIDDDDRTPSCSSNRLREDVSGRHDEGDDFSEEVDDLDEDERYYFRACAEDEDGDIVSGSVRSFTADDDDNNNDDIAEVEIDRISSIDDDSARINIELDMNDSDEVFVTVEFGEDEDDLDFESDRERKTRSDDFSITIDDLDDDTEYFVQVKVKDADTGEVNRSDIEDFETDED